RLPATASPYPYTTLFRSHDVLALEQRGAFGHQLGHAASVARALEDGGADVGHCLRIVQLQAARASALGQQGRREQQQLVLLAWRSEEHTAELQSREKLVC